MRVERPNKQNKNKCQHITKINVIHKSRNMSCLLILDKSLRGLLSSNNTVTTNDIGIFLIKCRKGPKCCPLIV